MGMPEAGETMITLSAVLSTSPAFTLTRRAALAALPLAGCAAMINPVGPNVRAAALETDVFIMPDGARLPYRAWQPAGPPAAAVLALHGFNDSRNAWELPGPDFSAAGFAVYAPDQRGFGAAPGHGLWAGAAAMVADAAEMAALVRRRHPSVPLVLMGESMGGAVLMCLAASPSAPPDARYVLLAPAVWGRAAMNPFMRAGLWLASALVPGLAVTGGPVRVLASDNRDALLRLSRDPLTVHATRFDTLRGLVDLMDAALAAAPSFASPGLFLYGGHDQLVPPAATAAMWRALAPGEARRAFYPHSYHLLLRDLERNVPIADIIAWVRNPDRDLPSAALQAADAWLANQA